MDNYEELELSKFNAILVELLFIACTAFTMIIVLNMLVAIMSDTFTKVYEKKQLYGMMTKLHFVSEIEKFKGWGND